MTVIDTGPIVLVLPSPAWADLVFHVLAHVRQTSALAASVYDPDYVRFVERHLGPAASRSLGADSEVLGRIVTTHPALSRIGLLAWLFREIEPARRLASVDLAALSECAVDAPDLLASLRAQGPAVEVLRCACELERPSFERLPAPRIDAGSLRDALASVSGVAPALADCTVATVRSLRLRGRVRGREIWIGTPGDDEPPSLDHVVFQALHEATVLELSRAVRARDAFVGERALEHAAVVLLAGRAAAHGEARRHAHWLAHFGVHAPPTSETSLAPALRELVRTCAHPPRGSG
jgi:hypothetical protein